MNKIGCLNILLYKDMYIYIYIYTKGKFQDFFRKGIFIDSTHMKL